MKSPGWGGILAKRPMAVVFTAANTSEMRFAMYRKPRRGDVYFANMNGATGSEQSGIRPVVIIQNDKGNHYSETTIVAMITSKKKRSTAVHVNLHSKDIFSKKSYVLTEQIRTISIDRLGKYVGMLSDSDMRKIDKTLKISLGLID